MNSPLSVKGHHICQEDIPLDLAHTLQNLPRFCTKGTTMYVNTILKVPFMCCEKKSVQI